MTHTPAPAPLSADEMDSRTAYAISTLRAVIRDSGESEWPEWFHAPWLVEDLCPLLDSLRAALLAARQERDALRDAAKSLLMLLDEWAWTAHHTVQSPGVKATVAQDDMIRRRNELWELVASRAALAATPEET